MSTKTTYTGAVNRDSIIPKYIRKQLAEPPPAAPGRHEALAKLTYQMVGERIPDDEVFAAVREWIPDTDRTEREIRDLIRGAHARNPQPATTGRTHTAFYRRSEPEKPKFKQFDPANVKTEPLPQGQGATTPIEFLRRIYGNEHICLTWADDEGRPNIDRVNTVDDWGVTASLPQEDGLFEDINGVYYCINPLNNDAKRVDANVADFRFLLVELEVPKNRRGCNDRGRAAHQVRGILCRPVRKPPSD